MYFIKKSYLANKWKNLSKNLWGQIRGAESYFGHSGYKHGCQVICKKKHYFESLKRKLKYWLTAIRSALEICTLSMLEKQKFLNSYLIGDRKADNTIFKGWL